MSLLPCPFCGGPAVVLRGIGCRNQGCFNPQVTQDKVATADEMPENAEMIVTAVNNHDALVEALRAIEWRGHQGKCPLCAGWDMSPNGETPGKHTKDCLVGKTLSAVSTPGSRDNE